jgi:hypothetical protein
VISVGKTYGHTPDSCWTRYACKSTREHLFYGLVGGNEAEFGIMRLSELRSLRGTARLSVFTLIVPWVNLIAPYFRAIAPFGLRSS